MDRLKKRNASPSKGAAHSQDDFRDDHDSCRDVYASDMLLIYADDDSRLASLMARRPRPGAGHDDGRLMAARSGRHGQYRKRALELSLPRRGLLTRRAVDGCAMMHA